MKTFSQYLTETNDTIEITWKSHLKHKGIPDRRHIVEKEDARSAKVRTRPAGFTVETNKHMIGPYFNKQDAVSVKEKLHNFSKGNLNETFSQYLTETDETKTTAWPSSKSKNKWKHVHSHWENSVEHRHYAASEIHKSNNTKYNSEVQFSHHGLNQKTLFHYHFKNKDSAEKFAHETFGQVKHHSHKIPFEKV